MFKKYELFFLENYLHKKLMILKKTRERYVNHLKEYLNQKELKKEIFKKYGNDISHNLNSVKLRLCLHASEISFTLDGKKYTFKAETDAVFENIRSRLRHE